MKFIWLIPLLPAFGAAVNGLVGIKRFSRNVAALVGCSTMGVALLLSIWAFVDLLGLPAEGPREHVVTLGVWIPPIAVQTVQGLGAFEIPWAFRLDPLSSMMLLVVTGIGFLIHVYSTAYMSHEDRGGYARFFCYLNLFCFFMLTLVLGSTFLVMFVGWEGVGLCSYLLIGFWYHKTSASDAGKKAFIVNRIGDWGFILGMFLVFVTFGTLDFRAVQNAAAAMPVEAQFGVLSTIGLLLFVGATGKSAQIPLYVWLPDAMEGPTPVSALIHAATMVTAGVYMVARNAVLFEHAPIVMSIIMVVGALTALLAASIGLVQYDIKRVLAYSTVSQLGYMFLATGVGAFAAGAFHLMTHAFFKALLFLCSGSVIHSMADEQDMRKMGALKKYLPITYLTMFIGTLAISGIPPFSGFFSKDEILYQTFLQNRLVWALGVIAAMMTAFYMYRLIAMTFYGAYRGPSWQESHGHGGAGDDEGHGAGEDQGHPAWHGPHESPAPMTVPLMTLAVGAVVAGFVGIPAALYGNNAIEHFLEPSFTAHGAAVAGGGEAGEGPAAVEAADGGQVAVADTAAEGGAEVDAEEEEHSLAAEWGLMGLSVFVALLGMGLAHRFYVTRPETSERLATTYAGAHRILSHKYYVDELYNATAVRGTMASAHGLWGVDRHVVDGAVNGSGALTKILAWISHFLDRTFVDGLVNLVGRTTGESSFSMRWLQTGLVQNYALWMLAGVFLLVSIYFVAM